MKKNSLFALVAFATGTAAAATPSADGTHLVEGYVCTVSRASISDGQRGYETAALAFNLTTEPECGGEWLDMNYACDSETRSSRSLVLCSRSASFSMAEQAMIQDQLLHAAGRNLPVDVIRGPCLYDDSISTCFEHVTIYNMPRKGMGRALKPQPGAR